MAKRLKKNNDTIELKFEFKKMDWAKQLEVAIDSFRNSIYNLSCSYPTVETDNRDSRII